MKQKKNGRPDTVWRPVTPGLDRHIRRRVRVFAGCLAVLCFGGLTARLFWLQLLDPDLAGVLDLEAVRPFLQGPLWRRIRQAKQVLREEPFITSLPASEIVPGASGQASVLVQGIADLVLVFEDHAEIVDYKTDRSRDPEYYKKEYAGQLQLYRRAFALRLGVPVNRLTIYAFSLQQEIDIPLQ